MEFHCRDCNTVLRCDDAIIGRKGKCQHCGHIQQIPTPAEEEMHECQKLDALLASMPPDPPAPTCPPGSFRHIFSKVVGVSFRNEDVTQRQEVIRLHCCEGLALDLDTEESNPHDANAIKVQLRAGRQIGYLQRDLARDLRPCILDGHKIGCVIAAVTGSEDEGSLGANILLVIGPPGATDVDAQEYVDRVIKPGLESEGDGRRPARPRRRPLSLDEERMLHEDEPI